MLALARYVALTNLSGGYRLFCANINTPYLHSVSLGPGANILGTIAGYDEPNMWILLENCQND